MGLLLPSASRGAFGLCAAANGIDLVHSLHHLASSLQLQVAACIGREVVFWTSAHSHSASGLVVCLWPMTVNETMQHCSPFFRSNPSAQMIASH
jgi:hypothetical protein